MKQRIINIAKFFVFLSIGVLLFWLVYRDQMNFSVTTQTVQKVQQQVPAWVADSLLSLQSQSFADSDDLQEALTQKLGASEAQRTLPIVLPHVEKNLEKLLKQLQQADYSWFVLALIISLASHWFRAVRWQMMMQSLGYNVRWYNMFMAVMIGYMANVAFPRLGEVTRCGVVARYEKATISQVLGTMVLERLIDVISLLVLTVFVALSQWWVLKEFLAQNPSIASKLDIFAHLNALTISLFLLFVLFVALVYIYRKRLAQLKLVIRVREMFKGFWEGLRSFKLVKNKPLFLFYTVAMWVCYLYSLYLCFFSFESTSQLSVLAGITALVMGSFGMIAPVQSGIGAWHFMVIATLVIYGADKTQAGAFALAVHGSSTLLLVLVGLLSLPLLPLLNRKKATT